MTGAAAAILAAARPEDVFGDLPAGGRMVAVKRRYRELAREVHPDMPGGDKAAFQRLEELRGAAERAVIAGTYGDPAATDAVLRSGRETYDLQRLAARGDAANVFYGVERDGWAPVAVKVARRPAANGLLVNEAKVLQAMNDADPGFPYVPRLLDSFQFKQATVRRQANVLGWLDGCVTLEEVRAAYPDGVGWQHAAWVLRRLLTAVGYAHRHLIYHCGVVPSNVLVHPTSHLVVLVDWATATRGDALATTLWSRWGAAYPPELLDKGQPGPQSDIYMAAWCAAYMMGGEPRRLPDRVPKRLRAWISGCAMESRGGRPDDAWALRDEFDSLLGTRRYVPLQMPTTEGRP